MTERKRPTAPPRAMEPDDLTRIRWISDPQLSPAGARAACAVPPLPAADDVSRPAIWVANPAPDAKPTSDALTNPAPRSFPAGATRDTVPRWSPDGRWLAFLSDRPAEGAPK